MAHGFYVHGVKMEGLVNLPEGWKYRTTAVEDPLSGGVKKGLCLEVHDLAASKISAFRPKDKDFVRTLIVEKLLDSSILMQRVREMSFDEKLKEDVIKWLEYTIENS